MNAKRSLALLLAAFALPAAFAGSAAVGSITGSGSAVTGDTTKALAAGAIVDEGSLIETDSGSGLVLNLSNGTKLVVGPGARIRLKFTGDAVEVTLFRGTVEGSFAAGSTVVSAGGVVNVGGATAAVQFTGNNLTAAAATGTVSMKPAGAAAAVTVPAGNSVTSNAAGTTTPAVLKATQVEAILNGQPVNLSPAAPAGQKTGGAVTAPAPGAASGQNPDLSTLGEVSPL